MARTITFSIGTMYRTGPNANYYNPTYLWGRVINYFTYWCSEYFDLVPKRVNSGAQVQFIQADYQLNVKDVWMWTRGKQTFISPLVNYGKNDWLCGMPTNHECCHWNNTGHIPAGNVMFTNGGRDNFTKLDCQKYLPYAFKTARRPWNETSLMRERFPYAVMAQDFEEYHPRLEEQHFEMRAAIGLTPESPQEDYRCCNHLVAKPPTWLERILPLKYRVV